MTNAPTISVLIVNYNAGKLLTQAVKSIINFPSVEVIVVDNDSKDDSLNLLRKSVKAGNLTVKETGANLGFGKGINIAASLAKGKYLYLLNPDAALTKKALSRMIETAGKHDDRAIVAPRLENPDGTPQPSCYRPQTIVNAMREYWLGQKGAYEKYLPKGKSPRTVDIAVAAAWLVPATVWQELGGLSDKFFLYFEDLDMCDRARAAGIPVVYDPQAVVKHAHGVSSRTNPIVMKLFRESALTYHGRFKKFLIDLIILSRNLFTPPTSTKKIIVLLLAWTALIFGIAALGFFLLPARYGPLSFLPNYYQHNFLLWSWANFDGAHYLMIAREGYHEVIGQSQYAFFPLFPLLINLVSRLGLDIYTAAHLVVTVSLITFAFALTAWAKHLTKNPLIALALILISPGAVFLLAIYSEPLYLALTALTFLFAEQKRWGRATLSTALATATRVSGIFLVLYLVIKMARAHLSPKKITTHGLIATSGLLSFMTYLSIRAGGPFAWFNAQAGWGKNKLTMPWTTISTYFQALTREWSPDLVHLTVLIEVIVTLAAIALLIKFWQTARFDTAYKWYALGNLALPLATGSLGSMPRFSLTLLPLLLIVPALPKRSRFLYLTLSLLMFATGIILFTRGYWYA